MRSTLDEYFEGLQRRKKVMIALREILNSNGLTEAKKWNKPCYTIDGKNIAMLYDFKDHCGLGFFKGVLLKDPENVLQIPGEFSRQSRYLKFDELTEVESQLDSIIDFIQQAIEVEKSGAEIPQHETDEIEFPPILLQVFGENQSLQQSFEQLTKGRQRGYLIHFTSTKNETTARGRIEKCAERILQGKGLHDCICGFSNRLPRCDGSHKYHLTDE
jgi:uncharacterized protein YdeI (YjbR/CyaY-like superfamily)